MERTRVQHYRMRFALHFAAAFFASLPTLNAVYRNTNPIHHPRHRTYYSRHPSFELFKVWATSQVLEARRFMLRCAQVISTGYYVAYMSGSDAGTNPEAWPPAGSTAERDDASEILRPRGHQEWWLEVQRLEAARDIIRSETPDPAALLANPDYQYLLGRLHTAQAELLAYAALAARLELGIQD